MWGGARTTDRKVAHCTLRVKVMMMTMMTTTTMMMMMTTMMMMMMMMVVKEFNTGTTQATPSCVKKYSRPYATSPECQTYELSFKYLTSLEFNNNKKLKTGL